MFHVQYYCPREAPVWQTLTEPLLLIFSQVRTFPSFAAAQSVAASLIWRYHAVRVIDPAGNIVWEA